jgi:hypothetical protein
MEGKKIIVLTSSTKENEDTTTKKVREKKEPKKRVEPQKWKPDFDFSPMEKQKTLVQQIRENDYKGTCYETKKVVQQIERKIAGYKQQDIEKEILEKEKLVTLPSILDSLTECAFKCYYCKEEMLVLYEMVREGKQWTVDRVNNDLGHNLDNYVLACLSCNLKRRCRTKDKFLFTKQLVISKV